MLCAAVFMIIFALAALTAQRQNQDSASRQETSAVTRPEMPSVVSPKMPSITQPGTGQGHYAPAVPPFMPVPPTVPTQPQNRTQVNGAAQTEQVNVPVADKGVPAVPSLTANRLLELSALAGTPQWSSLLSDSLQSGQTESASVDSILQNLLLRLEALEKTLPHMEQKQDAQSGGAQILRFRINGSDILSTCRDIYFSQMDSSGVFMLTGDRKFTYNQQILDETFYFLFHPKTTNAGTAVYDVAVSVSNADLAVQSYLKLLLNHSPLSAVRTGNLVAIRAQENGVSVDLLIDLGAAQN
jgi:hypothetical protein